MPLASNISADGKQVHVEITGRFDIALQREFRNAYRNQRGVEVYCIDLSRTEYIDSSALGMLLVLKDHANESNGKVVIEHPSELVKKTLLVAKFDEKFTIT